MIGLLSSLQSLYDPLLWCSFGTLFCGSAREQAPCAGGCCAQHGMQKGKQNVCCMCMQKSPEEQHLRLAANRDWPAQQPCVSVRTLALLGALIHFRGSPREQVPCAGGCYAQHGMQKGKQSVCNMALAGTLKRIASRARCQRRLACSAAFGVCTFPCSAGSFLYTSEALQESRHFVLVAAMHNMACGRASRAHTACACRAVQENSISGSLPTEIGPLSSLVYLYALSLSLGLWSTFQAL